MGSEKKSSGGSAAAGGMNFQAAVTAIAMVDAIAGRRLRWLDAAQADVPAIVLSETGGAGDDIALLLTNGKKVEVQAKKGLTRGDRLWDSVMKLARGLANDAQLSGVLVVCPRSSTTIRDNLSGDLQRMSDGRFEDLSEITLEFQERLKNAGIEVADIAPRLRVLTLHCLDADGASVKAAIASLSTLSSNADLAWSVLYNEGHALIERKGARAADQLMDILRAAGVAPLESSEAPGVVLSEFRRWTLEKDRTIRVPGHSQPLEVNQAWIELNALVVEPSSLPTEASEALAKYHAATERSRDQGDTVCARSLSRFVHPCVVLGGPGMGKSTLLRKLAFDHALEGALVLRFPARAIANRMHDKGTPFVEAMLDWVSSGFPRTLTMEHLRAAGRCLILCDGLDEAGSRQLLVAEGLLALQAGLPSAVIVATSRPVGYDPAPLAAWRHYQLLSILSTDIQPLILHHIRLLSLPDQQTTVGAFAREQLSGNEGARIAARSPLILHLVAAMLAEGLPLARSKTKLYASLVERLSRSTSRSGDGPAVDMPTLLAFLRLAAWELTSRPSSTKEALLSACGSVLAHELGESLLAARRLVEKCWEHWERVGVVETLLFRGDEFPTFIHKTFAEYGAALQLTALPLDQSEAHIRAHLAHPDWREVLGFAASMGCLDTLVRELLTQPGQDVLRSLALAANSDADLSSALQLKLCEVAGCVIAGPIAREAVMAAEAFVEFGLRYPEAAANTGASLLSSRQPWTRLAGLALSTLMPAAAAGLPAGVDLLTEVTEQRSGVFSRVQVGDSGLDIAAFPGRQVDMVSMHAVRRALDEHSADLPALVAFISDGNYAGTTNGMMELARLLQPSHPELARQIVERQWGHLSFDLDDLPDHCASLFAALKPLLPKAPSAKPRDATAWQLSGVLSAVDFNSRPASERWPSWLSTSDERVEETLRGLLEATSVNVAELAQEIADIELAAQQHGKRASSMTYDFTEAVDIRPNWAAGTRELDVLERAVYIPMPWLSLTAARLVHARIARDDNDVRHWVKRAVAHGKGASLRVVAAMTKLLPADQQLGMVLARVQQGVTPDLYHLVDALSSADLSSSPDILSATKEVLMSRHGQLAERWSNWLSQSGVNGTIDYSLLDDAFEHWKSVEDPYPEGGGVIPDSPRKHLLKMMVTKADFERARLLDLVCDPRGDVVEVALGELLKDLATGQYVDAFLHGVANGTHKASWLRRALKAGMKLTADQTATVRRMLFAENRRLRMAALEILSLDARPVGQDPDLARLIKDEDPEIRELARRMSDNNTTNEGE
ncbi:NACHT domain-containing protein [Dokdonella sp.]|uniref:NACHT domain-containing protein n=1 Tax=Dokdonella sp. TaxID=2291710 RepID=UPI001B05E29F|nr:NACHT domain-containing protein [Dokdonella sp.]MBO9661693.1 NACHT domain-containing protein [Dokdonella sp.]